jgi:hypothetical protein
MMVSPRQSQKANATECTNSSFNYFLPLANGSSPQDFDGLSFTGNGGNTTTINLESGTRQEFVTEIANHIILAAVFGTRLRNHFGDLEILVHIGTLLRDGLDQDVFEKRLGFGSNVL